MKVVCCVCQGCPATTIFAGWRQLFLPVHLLGLDALLGNVAAHRLGKHPVPVKDPLVKVTLKRLTRQYGKPRKQERGLTAEPLAAVKAPARIQRAHQGKRR